MILTSRLRHEKRLAKIRQPLVDSWSLRDDEDMSLTMLPGDGRHDLALLQRLVRNNQTRIIRNGQVSPGIGLAVESQCRDRTQIHVDAQERIKRQPVLGGLINEYERAA